MTQSVIAVMDVEELGMSVQRVPLSRLYASLPRSFRAAASRRMVSREILRPVPFSVLVQSFLTVQIDFPRPFLLSIHRWGLLMAAVIRSADLLFASGRFRS